MLNGSAAYQVAITGDVRRVLLRAILEIVDPDITYGTVNTSGAAPWSRPEQLHDKELSLNSRYAVLEWNRWLLDGSFRAVSTAPETPTGEIGHVGDLLSSPDGSFSTPVYAEITFSNCSILQACAVHFSDDEVDGYGVDFTVEVKSGDVAVYTQTFTGNRERAVYLEDFTVYDPTAIRVTVTRWSLPGRRFRLSEIVPGLYEEWTEDVLAALDVQMRGNFAGLAIPYGTCTLRMDNLDRRFEPRSRTGIFQSIEERQAIPVELGVLLEDGTKEFKRLGVFYQFSGGWRTGDNSLTMQWDLVDIVGLLAGRDAILPETLPTTLGGWLALLVGQLGANFSALWHVDPEYADVEVSARDRADVEGRKCGDLLRYACMASGTWPRADAETGYLTAEPLWSQGSKYDLDNMVTYPTMKANDDLAALIFKLYDGAGTTYVVSGNATSSSKTLSINNPFIHTQAQALTAARQILSQYGGVRMELTGRGNPASEIGDVDTVWLDESSAATGRRMEQSFTFSGGVLRDCRSVLLQADGSLMFENRVVYVASGVFHVPAGVTQLRILLAGGGQGGSKGWDGAVGGSGNIPGSGVTSAPGSKGLDGSGGQVWAGVINVNPDTDYVITVGVGGKASPAEGIAGEAGTPSTFGVYSSENGHVYPTGYSDVATGDSYGRTGVEKPANGTGDGGAGGEGGKAGSGYWKEVYWTQSDVDSGRHPGTALDGSSIVGQQRGWDFVVTSPPTPGKPGKDGAGGVCVISWAKE